MLQQMADLLTSGATERSNSMATLVKQFYDVIPFKEDFRLETFTLRDVVNYQDLCQVIYKY